LLYRGGLKKLLELAVDPSSLRGRGLGHRSDWHRRCYDVLASAIEDWGLLTPFVIVAAAVDIEGPPPSSSAIAATSLLLLESVLKLLQQESVLVDFCLELTELL